MSSPRVLFCIVTGREGYGVRQVWSDVFDGVTAHGWKIVVAVLEAECAGAWRRAHPNVHIESPKHGRRPVTIESGRWRKLRSAAARTVGQLKQVNWLTCLARKHGAAAIMIQSPPESLLAGVVARRLGIRGYWLVPNAIGNDVPLDLNRRVYRFIFRYGRLVPVSNSRFTDRTFGCGKFERHIVHLGVDTTYFRPASNLGSLRTTLGIPAEAPVVGLFARMDASKGQDRLIEALARSDTAFHVLLCGGPMEGAYANALRHKIERLGVASRVHIAGHQNDLRPYYAACDLIANLRVDAEPFGLTIIEAMACGKPVLAHAAGGPSEIVVPGTTGWLMTDVSVSAIASGLDEAARDRSLWRQLGVAGRQRAEASFSRDRFADQIVEIMSRSFRNLDD